MAQTSKAKKEKYELCLEQNVESFAIMNTSCSTREERKSGPNAWHSRLHSILDFIP